MLLIDLVAQVQRLLPIRFGGTGNDQGLGRGVVLLYSNVSGATIALYSLVKLKSTNDDTRVILTSAANSRDTLGVVVGRVITTGALAGEWEAVAPADGDGAAVMVSGRTLVLVAAAVTRGQFASSSATAGKAQGTSTLPPIGTFGIFEAGGSTQAIVRLSGGATSTAPEAVKQQGTSKVTDLTTLDFTDSLRVHASGGIAAVELEPSRAFLDALQVKVADAGALFTAPSPASGTETLRPTSDAETLAAITYVPSGSTGWNLVDEAVLDTTDYYVATADNTPWYVIHGLAATALDASKRITSITLYANCSAPNPHSDAFIKMRDPQTGVISNVHQFNPVDAPTPDTVTLTTRPWDSLPWTLDDLRHLQAGVGQDGSNYLNTKVRQVYLEVNWTAPKTVESVLQQVATTVGLDHGGLVGLADDDHTQYQKESEKAAASGYASLDSGTKVPAAQIATGTPDGTKFLRDDRTWQTVAAGSITVEEADGTPSVGGISKIKVGNSDLTDEGGGVVRIKTAADAAGGADARALRIAKVYAALTFR
jgi:hypothetical protein